MLETRFWVGWLWLRIMLVVVTPKCPNTFFNIENTMTILTSFKPLILKFYSYMSSIDSYSLLKIKFIITKKLQIDVSIRTCCRILVWNHAFLNLSFFFLGTTFSRAYLKNWKKKPNQVCLKCYTSHAYRQEKLWLISLWLIKVSGVWWIGATLYFYM